MMDKLIICCKRELWEEDPNKLTVGPTVEYVSYVIFIPHLFLLAAEQIHDG